MYYIVGADNQPRGPIDAATLNQWISEGRANGQTQARGENEAAWKPLAHFPEFAPALTGVASPPPSGHAGPAPPMTASNESDATGGLIPYKNKQALIGYYMAFGGLIAGCIPLIGIPYAGATIWLGIKGLKNVKENPNVKGTAHAWVAIILGAIELLAGLAVTVMVAIAILEDM